MATKPKTSAYQEPAYASKYKSNIDAALGKVTNRQDFTYDPLKDANYQAMAKVYQKQGEQAAKNTLGDAASLNGGYGSSFAVTASQQARNDYNQQLASQIPALQEAAYNRYLNNYNMDVTALNALREADESDYGRYRDNVADKQWKYGMDYQGYRDDVADSQWQKQYDRSKFESDRAYNREKYESDRDYKYKKSRDKVSDSQWAQEFALQKKSVAASSGGSSGGGSRSSGSSGYRSRGGSRSSSSGGSNGNGFAELWKAAQNKNKSSKKTSSKSTKKTTKKKSKKSSVWDALQKAARNIATGLTGKKF